MMNFRSILFCLLNLCLSFYPLAGQEYDIIIKNGIIYDGTGQSPVKKDIAIKGDKIISIDDLQNAVAKKIIDADGMSIAPGFIDLHAHIGNLLEMPLAESSMRQGITTALGGPDGGGPSNFESYLNSVNETSIGINVGYQVGHNQLRGRVMGYENRDPNTRELNHMQRLVEEAMLAGAFGLSTGLAYLPGTFSKTGEVIALARVAAYHRGFYTSHIRDESLGLIAAVNEAITIGDKANIPVVLTHHKALGAAMWGESKTTLKMVDAANRSGLDIQIDQYPYTASSTGMAVLIPTWAMAGGRDAFLERISDQELRDSIKKGIIHKIINVRVGYEIERLQFRKFSWKPELEGKTMADWTRMENLEPTPENAAELIIQAQINGGAQMIYHVMEDGDVNRIMAHPKTMIASDGSLSTPGKNHPHPRSYGTFPRVLGHYVREKNVLTLEEAINKMTGLPAKLLNFKDRGLVAENYYADLVIFDPAEVKDNATFEDPHQYPSGIKFVIVNGSIAIEDEELTGATGGKLLYGPAKK